MFIFFSHLLCCIEVLSTKCNKQPKIHYGKQREGKKMIHKDDKGQFIFKFDFAKELEF